MPNGLSGGPFVFQSMLRRIFHQATRIAHFVHHGVAHIGTGAAANALILQTLAYVDARGADLYTQSAIYAGTQMERIQIGIF